MKRDKKVALVEEVTDKLKKSVGIVFTDYKGLDVKQVTDLRSKLTAESVEYKVVKNTLTLIAADNAKIEGLEEILKGPTAIAFGYEDPVPVAKVLVDSAKDYKALKIKGGLLQGNIIGEDEVTALANLPGREVLLGKIASSMKSPMFGLVNVLSGSIRNLGYVLSAIKEQKEQNA